MNLLIHQDYGDHSRKAVIKFYQDGIQFWNPGDVFGEASRLMEPGEKEVRNPSIAMAMRRIAMCEQAGTGLRMMREEWQKLGHPAPFYKNDRSWKAFEFFIPELDKEVDMASDLMKAMFGRDKQGTPEGTPEVTGEVTDQVGAQEAQVKVQEAQVDLTTVEKTIIEACKDTPRTGQELVVASGYSTQTGHFKRSLEKVLMIGLRGIVKCCG